jgi:hypothetical protein
MEKYDKLLWTDLIKRKLTPLVRILIEFNSHEMGVG